jgi:hypothetical protein
LIKSYIKEDVATWMPFVVIESINVNRDSSNIDIYTVVVRISYFVPNIVGSSQLTLLLE